MVTRAIGPAILWSARREEKRLAAGATYEPGTIIERRNWTWPARLARPGFGGSMAIGDPAVDAPGAD
jgi:hypothetical protein